MDEMTMVRHLLDEAPPSVAAVDGGRERLLRASGGANPRMRSRRRGGIRDVVTLSLAGAAVVAVIVVSMFLPSTSTSPSGGGPFVADASARGVLLAAATQAEADPAPTTGAYWHVKSRTVMRWPSPQLRFGRAEHRYTMEQHSVQEAWTERNGRAWVGTREWLRPATSEDEAAWRRDGAPRAWCNRNTEVMSPKISCQRVAPGTASLRREYFAFEVAEGTALTYAQLQALPADADALRAWVERATRKDLDPSASDGIVNDNVGSILANLLVSFPVPPAVRGAAYRALAGMPDVSSTGPTRDELGRPGVGITIDLQGVYLVVKRPGVHHMGKSYESVRRNMVPKQVTRTLIIDPATSQVLADQKSSGARVLDDKLILETGWTDQPPHEPAEG
jgi:hypothetical protein